jgi:hypothetical protein
VFALLHCPASVPSNVYAAPNAAHDVRVLDQMLPGTRFYLSDRANPDLARRYLLKQARAFVMKCSKQTNQFRRYNRRPTRYFIKLPANPTIQLTRSNTARCHPDPPIRIFYRDARECPRPIFPANNIQTLALPIAELRPVHAPKKLFLREINRYFHSMSFLNTPEHAANDATFDSR